jgi:hypothetical protein
MKRLSIIIALAAMLGGQAYQVQAQGFTVNKKDGTKETYQAEEINKILPVTITNSTITDGQELISTEFGILIWMKDGAFIQYGDNDFSDISMFELDSSEHYNSFTLVPSEIHFDAEGGTIYVTVEGDGVECIESTSPATWLGFSFMSGSKTLGLTANPNTDKDERSTSFWVAVKMKDGSVVTSYFWAYQDGGAVEPEPEDPDNPDDPDVPTVDYKDYSDVPAIPTEIEAVHPIYEGKFSQKLDCYMQYPLTVVNYLEDEDFIEYVKNMLIKGWLESYEDKPVDMDLINANLDINRINGTLCLPQVAYLNFLGKEQDDKIIMQMLGVWFAYDLHDTEIPTFKATIQGEDNKFTIHLYGNYENGPQEVAEGYPVYLQGMGLLFSGELEGDHIKNMYGTRYFIKDDGSLWRYITWKDADGTSEACDWDELMSHMDDDD